MTDWQKRAISVLAVLCLGNGAHVATDPVDRVVAALQRGSHTPAARSRAATVLLATGAHAEAGTPDLAADWAHPGNAPYRNRALGPAYRLVELDAGAEITFDQTFLAGQRAHAALVQTGERRAMRPGAGRVELSILDETGAPQCPAGAADCSWLPLWTARYHIGVRNHGGQRQRTFLVLQ